MSWIHLQNYGFFFLVTSEIIVHYVAVSVLDSFWLESHVKTISHLETRAITNHIKILFPSVMRFKICMLSNFD